MGIHPKQIELLGRFGPPETSLGGLRVWPYVVSTPLDYCIPYLRAVPDLCLLSKGFVHTIDSPYNPRNDVQGGSDTDPLPSLDLSSLKLSPNEVAHAFHLPLSAVQSAPRLHHYLFRGQRPYHAVDVSDIVVAHDDGVVVSSDGQVPWASDPDGRDEIGGGREGRLEIWGLTGWYLDVLMRTLGVSYVEGMQPEIA